MSERKVAVTTEYSAGLPRGLAQTIRPLAPAIIYLGDREVPENQLSSHDVVSAMAQGANVRTAAINPTVISQSFKEIPGEILHIATGRHFTGNHDNALTASSEIGENKVEVFDSGTVSAGVALTALEAEKWAQQGLTREEIISKLNSFLTRLHVIGYVDNMAYAARGGRVSEVVDGIKKFLGERFVDGALSNFAATVHMDQNKPHDFDIKLKALASVKKALIGKMVQEVTETMKKKRLERVMIVYPEDFLDGPHKKARDIAEQLINQYKQLYGEELELYLAPLSPSVSAHIGPGSLGIAFVESE